MNTLIKLSATLALGATLIVSSLPLPAQPTNDSKLDSAVAAYSPGKQYDKLSWEAFVKVVTAAPGGGGLRVFETWATDNDTYRAKPVWPDLVLSKTDRPRFQPSLLGLAHVPGGFQRVIGGTCAKPGDAAAGNFPTSKKSSPPANCIAEEVRRNRASFDYIVSNGLYTKAGLKNAFDGPPITFPKDAIELKMDWIPVGTLETWLNDNGVKTAAGFVAANYYVVQSQGTDYALVSMHISTKQLPNWLWATFEHQLNPGRCDTMGCYDQFGLGIESSSIESKPIPMAGHPQNQYPACSGKTLELDAMLSAAGLGGPESVWYNYCLKATQIDFLSTQNATMGLPVLNGDSVIERVAAGVPIGQSSCMTCHAYAASDKDGCVQFSGNPGLGSPGPIGLVNWKYFSDQKRYDFVWGVINLSCNN